MINRNRRASWALWAALAVVAIAGSAIGAGGGAELGEEAWSAPPAEPFRLVSDLVELPEFIPGMGVLYVDPATLPVGPFLGYDRDGKLVHITLMIPLADMETRTNWTAIETLAGRFPVDHIDVMYNPGHPGVPVPHYHVTLWTISHEVEGATMQ